MYILISSSVRRVIYVIRATAQSYGSFIFVRYAINILIVIVKSFKNYESIIRALIYAAQNGTNGRTFIRSIVGFGWGIASWSIDNMLNVILGSVSPNIKSFELL